MLQSNRPLSVWNTLLIFRPLSIKAFLRIFRFSVFAVNSEIFCLISAKIFSDMSTNREVWKNNSQTQRKKLLAGSNLYWKLLLGFYWSTIRCFINYSCNKLYIYNFFILESKLCKTINECVNIMHVAILDAPQINFFS